MAYHHYSKNLLDSFTSFCSLLFNFQGPILPAVVWQLFNYITLNSVCQQLFYLFYKFFQTSLCVLLPLTETAFILYHSSGICQPLFFIILEFCGFYCCLFRRFLHYTSVYQICQQIFSKICKILSYPVVLYIISLFFHFSMVIFHFWLHIIYLLSNWPHKQAVINTFYKTICALLNLTNY